MEQNPRVIGDKHVKQVYEALSLSLQNHAYHQFPLTVIKTVEFIMDLYPGIKVVSSKFDSPTPDQEKDLTLHLKNGQVIPVNLFQIKKGARIQQKNIGALSFLTKYFLSPDLQELFNKEYNKSYFKFLNNLVTFNLGEEHSLTEIKELRKYVCANFPDFSTSISNEARGTFLYSLRETCFNLLRDSYNQRSKGLHHAFELLLMSNEITIITKYGGANKKDVSVEKLDLGNPDFNDIQLYKTGKHTVGIRFGEISFTLRFKFESAPKSSIKLAVSYGVFPPREVKERLNDITKNKIVNLITNHKQSVEKNNINAIGKCHEAISYYYFLKEYEDIKQAEEHECVKLLSRYYELIQPETLAEIFSSTATIIPVIKDFLDKKYTTYEIEEIELVPDSYLINKLDTGDIKLLLRVNGSYEIEKISLKAIAKKGSKVTTKNPGVGTILGEDYFNIGSLQSINDEVKSKFESKQLNHRKSLEAISNELGLQLLSGTQEQLKKGIESLLGDALMVVTFYKENVSIVKEHSKIDSEIVVLAQKPTAIQNTFRWNNNSEELSLRAKFSKSQSYGWSTIKFTSEYKPY